LERLEGIEIDKDQSVIDLALRGLAYTRPIEEVVKESTDFKRLEVPGAGFIS